MRTLAVVLSALVIVAVSSIVSAQSKKYPPPAVDVDQAEQRRSEFWRKVLHPHGDEYEDQIARARVLLQGGGTTSADEALGILVQASKLVPHRPVAYWLMGVAHEQKKRWHECADAYSNAFELAPDFKPATKLLGRDATWAVDFGLGMCLAQTGAYERAIFHFRRILVRGEGELGTVYRLLGQTYMALGRLDEALDALKAALRLQPDQVRNHYALAVAYDRGERPQLVTQHLQQAIAQDRGLRSLVHSEEEWVPAVDALYYQGLAHSAQGHYAWATAYFRHYLHQVEHGPWRHRIQQHLEVTATGPRSEAEVEISSIGYDISASEHEAVMQAVAAMDSALRSCVAETPRTLFTVDIHVVVNGRRAQGNATSSTNRRTSVNVALSLSEKPKAVASAIACLRAQVQQFSWNRYVQRGRAKSTAAKQKGTVHVSFPVIAPSL